MKQFVCLIIVLTFAHGAAAAAEDSLAKPCIAAKQPSELLNCIVSSGREIQKERFNIDAQTSSSQAAKQLLNPDLAIDSTSNTSGGRDSSLTLLFPIEIGRRSSRIAVSEANTEVARKQLLTRKEELAVQTVGSLYRLRQIDSEVELLGEAAETFHSIVKSYRNRLKLNPEQEVSLSVYEIASEQNELRLTKLSNERDRISASVSYDLGGPIAKELLPPMKTEWEPLSILPMKSSVIALARAQEAKAAAEVNFAQSERIPQIFLGPKIQYNTGDSRDLMYGFALSMSLPILNQNTGQRNAAKYNLLRSSLETSLTSTRVDLERELLIKSYDRSATAIRHAQSTTHLTERHKSLHKLIAQGIVSASLVIELHRQLFDYQSALHEEELNGIEALWRLYALDGSIAQGE